MISEKQLEANRANAQKSTGPKTEAGKKRSALNATRHGLTGQVVVLPEEDLAAFTRLAEQIVASFEPYDARERQLAHSYATFQWRINRAAAIEDTMFTLGVMEQVAENLNIEHPEAHNATSNAKTFRAEAQAFERLSIYTHRLVNSAAKVLKELQQLQAERRRRQEAEMAEAARLFKLRRMQSKTFDPKEIGFELTIDQIQAHIHRDTLNSQCEIAQKAGWNLPKFVKECAAAAA